MTERPTLTLTLNLTAPRDARDATVFIEQRVCVDVRRMLRDIESDELHELLRAIGDHMAASDFLEVFEDWSALADKAGTRPLTDRGIILLDIFVARAEKIGRLPDEYEPQWVDDFRADVDRLHRLICEGENVEAIDLLREMSPGQGLRRYAEQQNLFPSAAGRKADRPSDQMVRPSGASRKAATA
jgi:hypothetical protein